MSYWLHLHNIRYEISRRKERLIVWLAYRLPRSLAYWCAIRVGSYATVGKYSDQVVPELTFMDALDRWERR